MTNPGSRDWLQIGGLIGVIIGLLLVAYEVRQANEFAQAETLRGIYGTYDSIQLENLDSDIFDIYVKSYEKPYDLSASEMMKLDSWMTLMMGYWNQRVIMEKIGLNPRDTIQDFESFYSYVYGSPFSIAWYARNKAWMEPELIEVTDRLILDRPSQSMPEFVEDMNNRMRRTEQ